MTLMISAEIGKCVKRCSVTRAALGLWPWPQGEVDSGIDPPDTWARVDSGIQLADTASIGMNPGIDRS